MKILNLLPVVTGFLLMAFWGYNVITYTGDDISLAFGLVALAITTGCFFHSLKSYLTDDKPGEWTDEDMIAFAEYFWLDREAIEKKLQEFKTKK